MKKTSKLKGLESFNEETLNEMNMESVDGGVEDPDFYCVNNPSCMLNPFAGCGGCAYGG